LLDRAVVANTFLTPEWLLSWWQAYLPSASLCAITVRHEGTLVGLAPMMVQAERYSAIAVRCLRFMGDGTHESDHLGFVVDATLENPVHRILLDELLHLPWDRAVLANVPADSPLARLLPAWAESNRLLSATTHSPCPVRTIPASFDALLASMPSRFRTAIRSTRRKLSASHHVEFGLHEDPGQFDVALQTLFQNHESRWQGKGQTGVFVNPKRREFYRLLTQRLHEAGALRFFYLKLDGRVVAQEYCFAHGRTVYLLQEGFDFALAAQNIGNALRSFVFEYLIEQNYHAYDFLAGATRHKMNWSEAAPDDVTVTVHRRTPRGLLAHHGPRAVERGKDLLRPIRDRLRRAPREREAK
jgi:CelD/BcsL family acetyltransferase involved in cellulose biosynthesis